MKDNGATLFRGRHGRDKYKSLNYYKKRAVSSLGASPWGSANIFPNSYPREGYQNAPKFCEDTDKSMGTYTFNVPNKIKPGRLNSSNIKLNNQIINYCK